MKVFVLGGAGRFGAPAARAFAKHNMVTELVIAGRDLGAAGALASQLGDRVRAVEVDANDEDALVSALEDFDLFVNMSGPSSTLLLPSLRAAIRARTNYCDIAEDGRAVEQALSLDGDARVAGITALLGIGLAPGLTNLMAMHAAAQLDQVDAVQVGWSNAAELLFGDLEAVLHSMQESHRISAALVSILEAAGGTIRGFEHGRAADIDAYGDAVDVVLPHGGTVRAYPLGAAEPITLPRALPGVQSVASIMGLVPRVANDALREQAQRIAAQEISAPDGVIALYEFLAAQPAGTLKAPPDVPAEGIWSTATGRKDGRRVRYTCTPGGAWATVEGMVAASALKILRAEIQARGVLAPEDCLDPLPFLAEAARFGPDAAFAGELLVVSFDWLE